MIITEKHKKWCWYFSRSTIYSYHDIFQALVNLTRNDRNSFDSAKEQISLGVTLAVTYHLTLYEAIVAIERGKLEDNIV